jgi:hypothetical protein
VVTVNATVGCVPVAATGTAAATPSDKLHAVALTELHVSVLELPLATAMEAADREAVGTTFTVTVAARLVPPAPLHDTVYVAGATNAPVLCVPLVASAPLHPPAAVQVVALLELQVSVAAVSLATLDAELLRETLGASVADVTLTPDPQAASDDNVAMMTDRLMSRMAFPKFFEMLAIRKLLRRNKTRTC